MFISLMFLRLLAKIQGVSTLEWSCSMLFCFSFLPERLMTLGNDRWNIFDDMFLDVTVREDFSSFLLVIHSV